MVFSVFCAADVYGCKWNLVVEFPSHPRSLDAFHSAVEATFQYECQKFRPAGRDPWQFQLDFVSLLEAEKSTEPGQVSYYPGDLLSAERMETLFDGVQVYVHQGGVAESCGAIPPPRNSVTWPLLDMFGFEGPEAQMIPALFFKFDTRGTATVTRETMAEAFPGDASEFIDFVFGNADPRGLGYLTFGSWLEFAQESPRAVYSVQNEWMWQRSRLKQDTKPKAGSPRKRPAPGAEAAPFAELKADPIPEPTPSPQPKPIAPRRSIDAERPQARSRSSDRRRSVPHNPPPRRWGYFGNWDARPNAPARAPQPHIARNRGRAPAAHAVGVGTRGRRGTIPQQDVSPRLSPRGALRQPPERGSQRSPRAAPEIVKRPGTFGTAGLQPQRSPRGAPEVMRGPGTFGTAGLQPQRSPRAAPEARGPGTFGTAGLRSQEGRPSTRSRSTGQVLTRGRQPQRPPQQIASYRTRSAPVVSPPMPNGARPWQVPSQRRAPTPFGGSGGTARRGSTTGLLSARSRTAPRTPANGLTRQPMLASTVRSDLRNAASIDVKSLERRLLAQEEVWLVPKGPSRQSSPRSLRTTGNGRVSPRPLTSGRQSAMTVGSSRSVSGVSNKTAEEAWESALTRLGPQPSCGTAPRLPAPAAPQHLPRQDSPPGLKPREAIPPLPAPSVSSVPSPRGCSPLESADVEDAPEPQASAPQPTPPQPRGPSPAWREVSPQFALNGGSPTFPPIRPREVSPIGQYRRPESPLCVLDREFTRRRAWESRESETILRAGLDWSPQRMRTPDKGDGSTSSPFRNREMRIAESP